MLFRILILLILVTPGYADVTRKLKTSNQYLGASEGTLVEYYTSDRSANESTVKWISGIMKTMSGGKEVKSASITRLDRELIWTLDPKDKKYTEMTFAEFRDQMKQGMSGMETSETAEDTAKTGEEMYAWTVENQSDPKLQTINGWNCRNVKIIATGVNKQNPDDKILISLDVWNCPDIPGAQEAMSFNQRYLAALGFDATALTPGLMQAGMSYGDQLRKLMEEGKKAPGEPVKSSLEIKRRQLEGPSLKEGAKDAVAQGLATKIPFGFGKKESKPPEPKWVEKIKFRSDTELLEVSTDAVDPAKFEIPEGYKLKKK